MREGGAGGALLVGQHLGVGEPGVVVDGGVDVVVADAADGLAVGACATVTLVDKKDRQQGRG
ncbi:hypothetical protein GCM10010182_11740 [Actinomadura cremea]|nr:hypothetical protein GCM10010182_11740 [Actinomadura cremea]